jgi:xylulokinase
MGPRRIFAADIGSSSLKAGILDEGGALLAYAREPYWIDSQESGAFPPSEWADALKRALRRLPDAVQADAVAISGNGPSLVALDARGAEIAALHWRDPAPPPLPGTRSLFLPKIARFRELKPEAYASARSFVPCSEYVARSLTGESFAALPEPRYLPYFWKTEDIAAYGLDADALPPFAIAGELIGKVTASAAAEMGLREGIPVAAAGPDFSAALLGAGVLDRGMILDRAGTSEGYNLALERLPAPIPAGLRPLPHVRAGLWNLAALIPSSGIMFERYRALTGQIDIPYEGLLRGISALKPGSGGILLPIGAFEGSSAKAIDYRSSNGVPGKAELGLAVAEAIGFLGRRGLGALSQAASAAHGRPVPGEIRVSGGQSRNSDWMALKASILGAPLATFEVADAELSGCAACAMAALDGAKPDQVPEIARGLARVDRVYEPCPRRGPEYDALYDAWLKAAEAAR